MNNKPDHQYPRDYSDRQLLESIWRRLDGLAAMLSGPIRTARHYPDADPEDIEEMIRAWTVQKASRDET